VTPRELERLVGEASAATPLLAALAGAAALLARLSGDPVGYGFALAFLAVGIWYAFAWWLAAASLHDLDAASSQDREVVR
jgi:hypothetical protein